MEYCKKHGWDYALHADKDTVGDNCNSVVCQLSDDLSRCDSFLNDTRETHYFIFQHTTPKDCEYFAGNYRGANYLYLKDYEVKIAGYSGTLSVLVEQEMHDFSCNIGLLLEEFYTVMKSNNNFSSTQKLLKYIELISHFFVKLLAIHPYANGNGHIARLVLWCLLKKEGLPLTFWSIDERPAPPLDQCIGAYRKGDMSYLMKYFLIGITSGKAVTWEDLGVKSRV